MGWLKRFLEVGGIGHKTRVEPWTIEWLSHFGILREESDQIRKAGVTLADLREAARSGMTGEEIRRHFLRQPGAQAEASSPTATGTAIPAPQMANPAPPEAVSSSSGCDSSGYRPSPRARAVTPLSMDAYRRLNGELEHLVRTVRPTLLQDVATWRAEGRFVQNPEFAAVQLSLGETELRVQHLERLLESAVIEEPDPSSRSISYGSRVTLLVENRSEVFLVGSIEEIHPNADVVTPDSPLGRALWGRSAGDEVRWSSPSGRLVGVVDAVEAP